MNEHAARKALVVDDEEAIRQYLEYLLSREGFTVTVCADCASGLDAFYRDDFDVVLTDIQLPDRNGIENAIEMMKAEKKTKIVAMSGVESLESLMTISKLFDFDAILKKPFERKDLLLALQASGVHKGVTDVPLNNETYKPEYHDR